MQLNVLAPRNIAKACNEHKIKLIHISTDYVFGGVKCRNADELYDISDLTAPAGTYGTHKHLGELEIMKYMHKHDYAIMRTSWLYGTHKQKSFIHKFLKNAALNHAIKMTSNEYSVPTSVAYVISEILSCIIDKPKTNLIHCVPYADRGVSRF